MFHIVPHELCHGQIGCAFLRGRDEPSRTTPTPLKLLKPEQNKQSRSRHARSPQLMCSRGLHSRRQLWRHQRQQGGVQQEQGGRLGLVLGFGFGAGVGGGSGSGSFF